MIVRFDGGITAEALRAALSASDIALTGPDSSGVYHAYQHDHTCTRCDMPAALTYDNEPVCVRHWRELDSI